MRRADRLFQIVQFLRSRRLTTARWLAERLQVSVRTIYRDIQDLSLSGVPLEGEAGVGYVLRQPMDLPPLMFEREEIEALLIGARMVNDWADPQLQRAAESALAKIHSVLPAVLRDELNLNQLFAPETRPYPVHWLGQLRQAIRERRKLLLDYRNESGQTSQRRIWPLGLFFWGRCGRCAAGANCATTSATSASTGCWPWPTPVKPSSPRPAGVWRTTSAATSAPTSALRPTNPEAGAAA